jgi:transposase-like protein
MDLIDISQNFATENQAREFLESILWPDGPICPHCGIVGEAYKLEARKKSKRPVREGVWKCRECAKQFTVTVGTIFEDSHIPLHKWLMAIHLMNASKKGVSAHQMHRMLGLGYRAAWFMCHRIRHALNDDAPPDKLGGTVEIDETYVGGKVKGHGVKAGKDNKAPVVSLVERKGRVRSFHMEHVTAKNLRPIINEHLHGWSEVMTDEAVVYPYVLNRKVASHDVVCHSKEEYVRHENGRSIHTNSVESFFALIKRGVYGTFHHISKQHLHRYLSEFDFRYNARDVTDGERTERAIQSVRGKRLTYYETGQEGETSPMVG